jgi:hypothetical protein
MTRIASLVICALMLGLFVISQSFSSPNDGCASPKLDYLIFSTTSLHILSITIFQIKIRT